ncbi:MAG: hypothetical protein ACFCUG_06390 [Thiotrichales bacterium]
MRKWKKMHEIRLGALHFIVLALVLLATTVAVLRSISATEFAELSKPPSSGWTIPTYRTAPPPPTPIIKAAKIAN